MREEQVPSWDELDDDEKSVVEKINEISVSMGTFTPDRVLLFNMLLLENIVDILSTRIRAARAMGVYGELDARINVAGMVFSACLNECRDAFDVMHDPEQLAIINANTAKSIDAVEALMEMFQNGASDEEVTAFLVQMNEGIEGMVSGYTGDQDES